MELNKIGMSKYVIGAKRSQSTLKSMTKDRLIECLDVAQHNYECASEYMYNLSQYAEKLDKALDEACKMLSDLYGCYPLYKIDKDINCQKCTRDSKKCWRKHLMKGYEA